MPILTPEKVRTPAGSDPYNLTTDLRLMGESITSVVPVANTTERNALPGQLASAGRPVSNADPLYVHRSDAPVGAQLEYTTDGSTWTTVGQQVGWTGIGYTQPGTQFPGFGVEPAYSLISPNAALLRGVVQKYFSGSEQPWGASDVVLTLPPAARGSGGSKFYVAQGAGTSVYNLQHFPNNGQIQIKAVPVGGSSSWVALDGIIIPIG